MENKNPECDIVSDLMPFYLDKKVSSDSEQFIKRHLETCKECREMYQDVQSAQEHMKENQVPRERKQEEKGQKIFLKLQRRFFLALFAYVIVIIALGACLAWLMIY